MDCASSFETRSRIKPVPGVAAFGDGSKVVLVEDEEFGVCIHMRQYPNGELRPLDGAM